MSSPPQRAPMTDEEVRQMHRDGRRRAIVEALQQVVTTDRSNRQTIDSLSMLIRGGNSDQERDCLRLALADIETAQALLDRARVLIMGTGSIN